MKGQREVIVALAHHGYNVGSTLWTMGQPQPYGLDLNPMDYSIWSILESKACATSHALI